MHFHLCFSLNVFTTHDIGSHDIVGKINIK